MNYKRLLSLCMLTVSVSMLQAQSFESAADAVKNMGVGWNLGNTLEAHLQDASKKDPTQSNYWGQQGLESENCWGQASTKPELLKMMKEAGFGAIRVPVTWYNHMNFDGTVDAKWMARVTRAMQKAFNPEKINYGAYSDKLSHLHFHLAPKYVDGPDYGGTFQMNPGKVYLSDAEYQEMIQKIKENL